VIDAADDHSVVVAVGDVDAVTRGTAVQRHCLHVGRLTLQHTAPHTTTLQFLSVKASGIARGGVWGVQTPIEKCQKKLEDKSVENTQS